MSSLAKSVMIKEQGGVDVFEFNFVRCFILIFPALTYVKQNNIPFFV